jgi:hypothetical protein
MGETPSKSQILLARLVIVLLIAFTAVGVFWYGFSECCITWQTRTTVFAHSAPY